MSNYLTHRYFVVDYVHFQICKGQQEGYWLDLSLEPETLSILEGLVRFR